ncbi:MAG: ABC transporter transmembrane domain-containing protein [Erythrobacter sp.]|jgi:putative ABC transport system ATP-binding protein|uniref:ABC transporter transmembrane domain-containing protein n=1 Tax=Erythrobacter sp. TaxID=1042 RepID=UPI002B460A8A|nr:ABC transporter transmembrane domain-containing protein [Erythrobacter sp.]WRH71763.1 MAG: ABC transporter transmembrane domain-containing protein [Erythrobacter sp.]
MAGEGASHGAQISLTKFFRIFAEILKPESSFYWLAVVYGVGISLLSLATPISVQMLINTVANTALPALLVVLSITLFVLLLFSSLLYALRVHLMELFARRFYARMVSEISLIAIYAQNPFFTDTSRGALFNRYFDVLSIMSRMPILVLDGFSILLGITVGFVLVSLYHPLFLLFTLVMVALIWTIWLVWGSRAIRAAMDVSHAKHGTAMWLQQIGESNGFFKSQQRVDYAIAQTDKATHAYLNARKRYFRKHFSQTVSFLFLYASASAVLLGLGGWLVIQAELTLGQLVAAELVLSAAFFGVAQLGNYLQYFYELCAAGEEVAQFFDVEQETPTGDDPIIGSDHTLVFRKVRGRARFEDAELDFAIPTGAIVMASTSQHGLQRMFTNVLKMYQLPTSGYVTLGGTDLKDIEAHHLRMTIYVLDRPTFVPMTIRQYLSLSCATGESWRMLDALEAVGLADAVAGLEKGLDTMVAATGYPLSTSELLQLKLASAILARPRFLVLTKLFDLIDAEDLARTFAALRETAFTTVVYFSACEAPIGCSHFVHMEAQTQHWFSDYAAFAEARRSRRSAANDKARLRAQISRPDGAGEPA